MPSLSTQRLDGLPALAWLAEICVDRIDATVGPSVRTSDHGFFEGTWVGPSDFRAIPQSTTVFGSGVFLDDGQPVIVPPSHPLERLYLYRREASWLVSNSLAWLLRAAEVELDSTALYPPLFLAAAHYVIPPLAEIPTTAGPVTLLVYDNARLTAANEIEIVSRPRERPFASFDDYQGRLRAALTSARDNAPDYAMTVAISSGYDSTAVAAVAAALGCRRAVTIRDGKPVHGSDSLLDSGAATAKSLGMAVDEFDRLAYLTRADLPEAEFLATGMSGEDVVFSSMATALRRRMLLTGSEEFALKGSPYRRGLHRGDLSTMSLTEFRLRVDCIHVPLLFFGATEQLSLTAIIDSAEMQPYAVSGHYDKPIQRRLAEDAGVARGSFAIVKRRASGAIHKDGLAALAPATVESIRRFTEAEGRTVKTPERFKVRRWHRFVLGRALKLGIGRRVAGLWMRKRALTHFEPDFGSILLRWAVSVVSPRYAIAAERHSEEPVLSVGSNPSERVDASVAERP